MRKEIRRVFVAAALALSITNAAAAPYTFSNLYDSSGPSNGFDVPYLVNSGTVAFGAALDIGRSGIFTGSGGATTTIVNASGPFADLRNYSLNNDGTVAFLAGNAGAFTGSGGPITTIFSGPGFSDFFISVSINDNGTVALLAELEREDFFTAGIFTGRGGALTPLYEDRESGTSFGFGNFVPINDSGTVAFLANLDPFSGAEGIVTGSGGPTTTIADNSGPFSFFYSSEGNPTLPTISTTAARWRS